jgi:hypothetical protein
VNADAYASDYRRFMQEVTLTDKIQVKMAPGGGFIAHFRVK